ncbi:transposase, partial [Corynebacterium atrinae]
MAEIYWRHVDDRREPYLGSQSSFYRLARMMRAFTPVPRARTRPARSPVPQVTATGPGQVFVWDVTWILGSLVRQKWALYQVMDLYSRKIVGWTIQPGEDTVIATDLIEQCLVDQGIGTVKIVHSDNGSIMTSKAMTALLGRYNVTQSLIRPSVSNDNPQCESLHRTVKRHRLALEVYTDITQAYETIAAVIEAYNTTDHHSGIASFTPEEVFTGEWVATLEHRRRRKGVYYRDHRQRFHAPPKVWTVPHAVTINLAK